MSNIRPIIATIATVAKYVQLLVSAVAGTDCFVVKGLDRKLLGQRSAALEIDNESVVEIAAGAFKGLGRLTGVSMSKSKIRVIGESAFERCDSVVAMTFPPNLVKIPARMCKLCASLTSIDLPDVQSIGAEAFLGCRGLKTVRIPASVRYIDEKAFMNCGLERVVIEGTDVEIAANAFDGNAPNLEIVRPPESRAA